MLIAVNMMDVSGRAGTGSTRTGFQKSWDVGYGDIALKVTQIAEAAEKAVGLPEGGVAMERSNALRQRGSMPSPILRNRMRNRNLKPAALVCHQSL